MNSIWGIQTEQDRGGGRMGADAGRRGGWVGASRVAFGLALSLVVSGVGPVTGRSVALAAPVTPAHQTGAGGPATRSGGAGSAPVGSAAATLGGRPRQSVQSLMRVGSAAGGVTGYVPQVDPAGPRPAAPRISPAAVPASLIPAANQYVPLTPARIRTPTAVAAGGTLVVNVRGAGGVPVTTVVAAAALHVSVSSSAAGSLTVYATSASRPATTNISYQAGAPTTGFAMTPLGPVGQITVFSTAAATVAVDVLGYTTATDPDFPEPAGSTYVPLPTVRILGPVNVTPAGGSLAVAPLGAGGIPTSNVTAIAAHVVYRSSTAGTATVYPDGVTKPATVDLQYGSDYFYTNLVVVKLGTNGQFRVTASTVGMVDVDVVGYYQGPDGPAAGSTFVATTATRTVTGRSVPANRGTTTFSPLGTAGVPASGVSAVAFTLTATGTVLSPMNVYPTGTVGNGTGDLYYHNGGNWSVAQVAKLGDGGQITIRNVGTAAATVTIDVVGYYLPATAPGVPGPVFALARSQSAFVDWRAPSSDGGAAITSYTVTAHPGGQTATVSGALFGIVSGLNNGDAYTFTVSATNGAGTSPESAPSSEVIPAVHAPDVPANVRVVSGSTSTSGTATVSWDAPYDGGSPILDYTVVYGDQLLVSGQFVSQTTTATSITLTGLPNSHILSVTVAARNSIGTGSTASSPSFVPHGTPVGQPAGVVGGPGDRIGTPSVTVYWNDPPSGAGRYKALVRPLSGQGGVTFAAQPDWFRTDFVLGLPCPRTPEGLEFCFEFDSTTSFPIVAGTTYQVGVASGLDDGTFQDPVWVNATAGIGSAPPAQSGAETYGCPCSRNSLGRSGRAQGFRADPVNTATGAFSETATDAQLPGAGLPFAMTRTYTSLDTTTGILGPGWTFPYAASLVPSSTGPVTVRSEDGQGAVFTRNTDGSYAGPPGVRSTLSAAAGGWRLTAPDRHTLTFNAAGQLTATADRLGNALIMGYAGGQLTTVTDTAGRVVHFGYTGSLLSSVTLPDGRHVDYGYTIGRLASVRDLAGGSTGYHYDAGGRLDTITDQLGHLVTSNVYNNTTGKVTSQFDALNKRTDFTYSTGVTTTTDRNGLNWFDYYSNGVLIASVNPLGKRTDYRYDSRLNLVSVTDPRGHQTTLTYDPHGNLTSTTAPAPLSTVESWTYTADDQIDTHTDGRGHLERNTYDPVTGLLRRHTDRTGGVTDVAYFPNGQLHTATDPRGKTTTFGYDPDHNLTEATTPQGEKTTLTYDPAGRPVTVVDPRGNVPGGDPAAYTSRLGYDDQDRLTSVTGPLGHTATVHYDAAGRQNSATDAQLHTTTYGYNDNGWLTTTTDPLGRTAATRGYDPEGRLTASTDGAGDRTTYKYGPSGLPTSLTTARGNVTGTDPAAYTWTYQYDANGNRTTQSHPDPTGGPPLVTTTSYDVLDRPIKVVDPLGHPTTTTYDANNNVTDLVDALSHGTHIDFDNEDRPLSVRDGRGKTITIGYDPAGNTTSRTDPAGDITTWTYDDGGRLASTVDPRGNITGANPDDYRTAYGYDPAGNHTSVTDPLGHATISTFDATNRLATRTDPNGHRTTWTYDENGRLTRTRGPDASTDDQTTRYGYDDVGNLTTRTDPNNHLTRYGYDLARRLASVEDPLHRTWTYGYNADSNPTTVTSPAGVITAGYDSLDRLTGYQYSDTTAPVGFGYDRAGRQTVMTDGAGTQTYGYDDADRLTAVTRGPAAYGYRYDNADNLTQRTYPDGSVIDYGYDDAERQTTLTADGATTTFGYDLASHPTTTTRPAASGLTTTRTWDRAGWLTGVRNTHGTAAVSAFTLSRDPAGNPQTLTSQRGGTTTTEAYQYDPADRLTAVCSATADCATATGRIDYRYDLVGNRVEQRRTDVPQPGQTTYRYDDADELTTATTSAGTTAYGYDSNGRLTSAGAATATYNLADQFTSATTATATVNYSYDGNGNRLTANHGGSLTRYSWDENAALPQLATETDGGGTTRASYRYSDTGPESLRAAATTYLLTDPYGSVTDTTNATGTPQRSYTYEPYGAVSSTTTTDPTAPDPSLRYNSQLLDPDTGLYDLRARQYDPTLARFTTTEPLTPPLHDPYVSAYAYANDRPTTTTDPSGQCGLSAKLKSLVANPAMLQGKSPCELEDEANQPTWSKTGTIAAGIANRIQNTAFDPRTTAVLTGAIALGGLIAGAGALATSVDLTGLITACAGAGRTVAGAATGAGTGAEIEINSRAHGGAALSLAERLQAARVWVGGLKLPQMGGPPNGMLVKRSPSGAITNYAEYDSNGNIVKRVDLTGRPHGPIPTPHTVEYVEDHAPDGQVRPREATVRKSTPDEVP
ncbi:MAG: hypothetical protein V7637_3390 [Mycobacteriales bacterium]|jgi:RHS repeat-associated protein